MVGGVCEVGAQGVDRGPDAALPPGSFDSITPASQNGSADVTSHSNPPIKAAGAMVTLRIR
jgi:hypothetical protein